MTIKVDLNPEDESRLAREAEVRGVRPERYARDLLQAALTHGVSKKSPEEYDYVRDRVPDEGTLEQLRIQQFHHMLYTLARGAERLPNLPTESFTRESFYEDRSITNDA